MDAICKVEEMKVDDFWDGIKWVYHEDNASECVGSVCSSDLLRQEGHISLVHLCSLFPSCHFKCYLQIQTKLDNYGNGNIENQIRLSI